MGRRDASGKTNRCRQDTYGKMSRTDTRAIKKVDDEIKCVVNKRMNKEHRERERE